MTSRKKKQGPTLGALEARLRELRVQDAWRMLNEDFGDPSGRIPRGFGWEETGWLERLGRFWDCAHQVQVSASERERFAELVEAARALERKHRRV